MEGSADEAMWQSWLGANKAKLPAVLTQHILWVSDHTNSFDEARILEQPPTLSNLLDMVKKGRASSHASGVNVAGSANRRATFLPTKRPLTLDVLQRVLDQDGTTNLDEDEVDWLCDCLQGYHPGAIKGPLENWLFDSFLCSAEEIIPGLWLGGLAVASDLSKLEDMDIANVLCVGGKALAGGEDHYEPPFADRLEYLVVDVNDTENSAEALGNCFEKSTKFIEGAVQSSSSPSGRKGNVLVHCMAGVSRSASVICAYLISCHNMPLADAVDVVRSARPVATPNAAFVEELRKWEARKHAVGIPK